MTLMAATFFSVTVMLLLPSMASGQTFCTQGILPCVQNAVCNATSDQCECASGFYGNGRVSCNPATRCTCTALADPMFGLFDTRASVQTAKVNLPCSVRMVDQAFVTNCVISMILAHPEVRGMGSGANLRVFVNELEVSLLFPLVTFTLNSTGTTVTAESAAAVTSAVNSDSFQTATVASCSNLQIGYNGTYAGAYIDAPAVTFTNPGLCGNCDDTADENVGNSNVTNFAYFLGFVAPFAEQKGPFATECGNIQAIVSTQCSTAELNLVADVCFPYLSPFGTCLIDDAAAPTVTDFATLITTKFTPCLTDICVTGSTGSQCTALLTSQTTGCQVDPLPTNC